MTTAQPIVPEEKLDFKKIMPIFLIMLVDLLGLTIIIPLLPLYATTFGIDAGTIGLLSAVYPIMQFIGAPVLGRLSDRYGRKPILIITQIGTFIGFLVLGFANTLWMLFLSRIIDGLSGANIATAQAMITDVTTEKTRTQGLGLLGAAFGLGFIVGPLIAFGSLAASGNNYHVPAFVAAAFSAVSILLSIFYLQETRVPRSAVSSKPSSGFGPMIEVLRRPQIGILLVLLFAQQLCFGGFEQILSLFTLNRLGMNASGNSILFVFIGIFVVLVQGYFIRQWSVRFGDVKLINLGLVALGIGLVMTAVTPTQAVPWYSRSELERELTNRAASSETTAVQTTPVTLPDDNANGWGGIAWLIVAMIPASIGGGVLQPSINSLITKCVSQDDHGSILGIGAAFLSAANALGPLVGGVLFSSISPSSPFLVWAAILFGLLVAALFLLRPRPDNNVAAGLTGY
jgi:DHA1 family tetracycline resistance protein-like MFS transporter